MSDDLYFIPLIAEALRQADAKTAMRQAFRQIQAMGQEPRYRIGYQQFLSFMESARQSPREHGPDELGSEILKAVERPTTVTLLLEKGNAAVATCSFERGIGTQTISGVQPGDYRLTADSGRVLWTGSLTGQDLLWASARPGQGLPLAADTGSTRGAGGALTSPQSTRISIRISSGRHTSVSWTGPWPVWWKPSKTG